MKERLSKTRLNIAFATKSNYYNKLRCKGSVKVDLLLWITISFIIIGFVILTSIKKDMESKVAFIKANEENEVSLSKAKSVIWWIWSAAAFGIVSIFLVVWCFHNHFG